LRAFLLEVQNMDAADVDTFFPQMLADFNSAAPVGSEDGWRRRKGRAATPSPVAYQFAYSEWALGWLSTAGHLRSYGSDNDSDSASGRTSA
jgi:hypothetical protein